AQGVLYLSLMGLLLDESLQRVNGLKNVLAAIVNGIAALFFIDVAQMDWAAVALIAAGATIGGMVGARVGRRLPPAALRGLIVVVGIVAIVQLALK
ncbi:MAG: sulfite exporter TauE/SafE family protein, partial [Actinomycetia bacterium]|nr:sulfite exporter TauE/SafE family protein [Actinomycetes bacterium]